MLQRKTEYYGGSLPLESGKITMKGYVGLVIIAAGGLLAWLVKCYLEGANAAHWNGHTLPPDAYTDPGKLTPAQEQIYRQKVYEDTAKIDPPLSPLPAPFPVDGAQTDTALPGPQSSSYLAPEPSDAGGASGSW